MGSRHCVLGAWREWKKRSYVTALNLRRIKQCGSCATFQWCLGKSISFRKTPKAFVNELVPFPVRYGCTAPLRPLSAIFMPRPFLRLPPLVDVDSLAKVSQVTLWCYVCRERSADRHSCHATHNCVCVLVCRLRRSGPTQLSAYLCSWARQLMLCKRQILNELPWFYLLQCLHKTFASSATQLSRHSKSAFTAIVLRDIYPVTVRNYHFQAWRLVFKIIFRLH